MSGGGTEMKEAYFTPESIDQRAREMLAEVRNFRERHRPEFAPERAALLVLDMQRYFLEKNSHAYIPSAGAIVPKVKELVTAFSARGLPVVFTRHLNTEKDAGRMAAWWRDLIAREDPLSELIPNLEVGAGMVIEKGQYDAFYGTALEEILKERGVSQVAICGVMAHLCCETTARAAFVRGFEVFFIIDGTATYNERFHRATLLNLAHGFAYPLLVEELLAELGRGDVC
jgi:isochorismate hydrolase